MSTEAPIVDQSILDFNWGQPELAAERREHLLNGWVAQEFERDGDVAQREFTEADKILTEILDNKGILPLYVGSVKYGILFHEAEFLKQIPPALLSSDGLKHKVEDLK